MVELVGEVAVGRGVSAALGLLVTENRRIGFDAGFVPVLVLLARVEVHTAGPAANCLVGEGLQVLLNAEHVHVLVLGLVDTGIAQHVEASSHDVLLVGIVGAKDNTVKGFAFVVGDTHGRQLLRTDVQAAEVQAVGTLGSQTED